jgi:hypothetical protein
VVLPGTYTYTVRALDAADNLSDPSNSDTATVTAPDLIRPCRPRTWLRSLGSTQVNLTWTRPRTTSASPL